MSQSAALFCPKCSSPLVDYSVLTDEGARCNACRWGGRRAELLTAPFSVQGGAAEESIAAFAIDIRNLLGREMARPLILFLAKWGFITPGDAKAQEVAARYLTVVARAMARAIMEERAKIEQEGAARE